MPIPLSAMLGRYLILPTLLDLVRSGLEKAQPYVGEIISDPSGHVSRIGDLIVWNGVKGRKVLAGLQSLGENQERIDQAITSIESSQLAANGMLGAINAVSITTLGIASLTGGLMLWRLQALDKRFERLSRQIHDLEDTVDAQNRSHLGVSIQRLRAYDHSEDDKSLLKSAKEEAQHAANIYGQLTQREAAQKKPRLEVLNYRGRCYLTALIAEMRSSLLQGDVVEVSERFKEETGTIEALAKATFDSADGLNASAFLSADMLGHGVTLELMAEIYQNAYRLGAFREANIKNAIDMFEYCRATGIEGTRWRVSKKIDLLARKLKFLIACLEDIGRIESLKLLADTVKENGRTFKDIQDQVKGWHEENRHSQPAETIFAYSL